MREHPVDYDPVKHPKHYTWIPGIECIDVVKYFNFCMGGAIKYIWRADRKGNKVEDLQKAIELLQAEIKREIG
uniref:Putative structural protein n=1 Tax=viral metagenome TaxID=1070528 RepID=A0A6M3LHA5_9ZZZZ